MRVSCAWIVATVCFATATCLSGCTGSDQPTVSSPPTKPAAAPKAAEHDHDHHSHDAGPHDGTIADWGGGKYHVEFTVDHDKKETIVYVLDGEANTPVAVKAGTVLLNIVDPKFQVELKAKPLEGEAEGSSSRFVGTHDSLGIVKEFQGTISAEVDGTPYVADFKEEPHSHN